jgi:hypothetical protein
MANATLATPNYLVDPGVLYFAVVGTPLPANTVGGSVFTDTWASAGAWVQLGMTETGSDIDINDTASPIAAAERREPLGYQITTRTTTITFSLKGYTASNLARAYNGATTAVTGTGATTLTKVSLPTPGAETRFMLGWESTDSTVRWVAYQCLNTGSKKMSFAKAPATALIPFTAMGELSSTYGQASDFWFAGANRA